METKTIVLKEFEGKRYEIDLLANMLSWQIFDSCVSYPCYTIIYHGSVSDFLQLPNKEEIAEKVVSNNDCHTRKRYKDYNSVYLEEHSITDPIQSLLSAIGDYKYFILTETEI